MSRKKSKAPPPAPRVLDPLRGCKFCGGTGWVQTLTARVVTRQVQGLKPELEGRRPVERCSCTIPNRRDQVAAPEPAPAELDQAQRAAGEKED